MENLAYVVIWSLTYFVTQNWPILPLPPVTKLALKINKFKIKRNKCSNPPPLRDVISERPYEIAEILKMMPKSADV